MAEATAVSAPAGAPAQADGRGRKKLLLIVGLVLAVAAGIVGGTMFLGGGGETEAGAAAEPEPEEGDVVTVSQMTVSLSDTPAAHFARVEFAAVLEAGTDASMVEPRFPLLEDAALSVIMSFSAEQLRTVEGADALRSELTARAQDIYPDGEVLRIVLSELLVQ